MIRENKIAAEEEAANSSKAPTVVAIVLNHRTAGQTIRCVSAIREVDYPALTVLVVDNDSGDDSVALLRQRFPDLRILLSPRNLGYGDGVNFGLRAALAAETDFVWVVTPDTTVRRDSLGPLLDAMRKCDRIGICGSIVHAGELCIVRSELIANRGFLARHQLRREEELSNDSALIDSDYVDGCSIFLRAAMVREIGLFRDDWFLYYEEAEYCLRAREAGWLVRISPSSHVFTQPITKSRNNRTFYMIRNSILLARTRKKHRLRTVMRHFAKVLTYSLTLRQHPEYDGFLETLRPIFEGVRKPLSTVPRL